MNTKWHFNTAANRRSAKYSAVVQLRRVGWYAGNLLMRMSPRPFFAWRRVILRAFGATVGRWVNVYPTTHIVMPWNLEIGDWSAIGEDALIYNLGRVTIGSRATVSYRAHVCAGTHDFADPTLPLLKLPVVIRDGAWIGTDAFIGPGVTVGEGAIVGARAVVVGDVSSMAIVAGNPARQVGSRENVET